jgi:hypothetical protein
MIVKALLASLKNDIDIFKTFNLFSMPNLFFLNINNVLLLKKNKMKKYTAFSIEITFIGGALFNFQCPTYFINS